MTAPSVVRAVAARTPAKRRLGKIIRERRTANDMTQGELGEEVARGLGLDEPIVQQSVARWEAGLAVPSLDTLIVVADVLAFSLDDIRGSAA